MLKKNIIYFLGFVLLKTIFSCQKDQITNYVVEGVTNTKGEKIHLIPASDLKYYGNFIKDSATIVNNTFKFKLSINKDFPLPFFLVIDNHTVTRRFILEPKNQTILIDTLRNGKKPKVIIENSLIINEELSLDNKTKLIRARFNKFIKDIENNKIPKESYIKLLPKERDVLVRSSDSILADVIKESPNSYFLFWELVIRQSGNGYSKEIERGLNNLSNTIKKTEFGKSFKKDLANSKLLNPGNKFPEINLKNKKLEEVTLNLKTNFNSKYTLIDFWFSNCVPCIKQFPQLNEVYSKYDRKDFEIIGISTDRKSEINSWMNIMKKNKINWDQFLDLNGIESSKLGVNKFPTNFLINDKGVILRKDIPISELEKILIGSL